MLVISAMVLCLPACNENNENTSEDTIYFELNDNGKSYIVKGANFSKPTELVIPQSYNGLPVIAIEQCAFRDNEYITSVTIPESITYTSREAFGSCHNLKTVKLPDSFDTINGQPFSNCTSLTKINIPDGVTYIGPDAFSNCTALESINIPSSVRSIDYHAFYNCTALVDIKYDFINEYNNLHDASNIFGSDSTVEREITITIGSSVLNIPNDLFYPLTSNIKRIIFEKNSSCQIIEAESFNYASSHISVYYSGTFEDWERITSIKAQGSGNRYYYSNIHNAKVYYYSEEKPNSDGNYWHYNEDKIVAWND